MWWDERMAALDLETTATDPEQARIVTAAIVYVGGGQPAEPRTWLADPGVEIPDEAAAVHGVTTDRARAEGRPVAEVLAELLAALVAWGSTRPLIICNARYDLTVLDRELRRHGLGPLPPLLVIDPLVLDKHVDRYRPGSRKLVDACEWYRLPALDAHDALADALAAARLVHRIVKLAQIVRQAWNVEMEVERDALIEEWDRLRLDPAALFEAQRRWAADQAVGLAEHFGRNGDADLAAEVRSEWPVIPFRPEQLTLADTQAA